MHFDQIELLYVPFKILIHDSKFVVIIIGFNLSGKNGKSLSSSCNLCRYSTSTFQKNLHHNFL